jgi:hypothetical protein
MVITGFEPVQQAKKRAKFLNKEKIILLGAFILITFFVLIK